MLLLQAGGQAFVMALILLHSPAEFVRRLRNVRDLRRHHVFKHSFRDIPLALHAERSDAVTGELREQRTRDTPSMPKVKEACSMGLSWPISASISTKEAVFSSVRLSITSSMVAGE